MYEDSNQSVRQHAGTAASIAKNTILLIKGNCPEMFLSGAVNGSISKKVLHNCVNHSSGLHNMYTKHTHTLLKGNKTCNEKRILSLSSQFLTYKR